MAKSIEKQDNSKPKKDWTSLEIAKFTLQCFTALFTAGVSVMLFNLNSNVADKKWTNQKLAEKRIELYDQIIPNLNKAYCFHAKMGDYQKLDSNTVISAKRKSDHVFYCYRSFLSDSLIHEYEYYTDSLCFDHPPHKSAIIRSGVNPDSVKRHYFLLMDRFVKELRVDN